MSTEQNYLDINSLKELPESHAWDSDRCPSVDFIKSPIPVVDLLNDENAQELIGNACKEWGVFIVVNHNFRKGLLDEIDAAARSVFALPMEQKLKVHWQEGGGAGYGLPAVSHLYPKLHWKEGFTIVGSPLEHAKKLWPSEYQTFCDVIEEYQKELKTLATRMAWLMLGALGITENDVEWEWIKKVFEGGFPTLQLNAYPPCPDPDRAMGLVPHTDSSIITLLYQSSNGLEVHKEGIGWVGVPHIPGSLIVIVGDMFHILSNGLYNSVSHRAVVNNSTLRVSTAYFYGPKTGVKVAPLSNLVDHSHPQLYKPVTWNEYRELKFKYNNSSLGKMRIDYVDCNDNPDSVQD